MNPVSTVGLDLAKHIFQLHGADSPGAVVFRQKLRRGHLLSFLATLPPCTIAMERAAAVVREAGHQQAWVLAVYVLAITAALAALRLVWV